MVLFHGTYWTIGTSTFAPIIFYHFVFSAVYPPAGNANRELTLSFICTTLADNIENTAFTFWRSDR